MKILFIIFFGLFVTIFMSPVFGEDSPYLANIWDNRILQKAEKRLDIIAKEGQKEQLVQIIGLLKTQLGILTDAKSQYILFELARLAEERLTTAITVFSNQQEQENKITSGVVQQEIGSEIGSETSSISGLSDDTTGNSPETFAPLESGKASYYAGSLQGNNTANGDTFDNNAFTAAHKTLPFNTRVKVINTKNNLRVLVRINDRGPFTPGRVIDLSQSAFKALNNDSLSAGILDVTLEVVK